MEKKQFDKIRLTTQMNEMVHIAKTSPYKSQVEQAKRTLNAIQEQYKAKFGEYSADHLIVETYVKTADVDVYDVLSSATFEKWYKKDFIDHIEGVDGAKSKEEIINDIAEMFKK